MPGRLTNNLTYALLTKAGSQDDILGNFQSQKISNKFTRTAIFILNLI